MQNHAAINARARGLSTHLLSVEQIQELARLDTLSELVAHLRAELKTTRFEVEPDPVNLESALRRWAGDLTQVLQYWLKSEPATASVLFLEDQLHAVRRIARGVMAGHPPAWRLAAALPVPELPNRMLEELAGQSTLEGVAGQLFVLRSPFSSPIAAEARQASPDAFRLDLALRRTFVGSLSARARKAGSDCVAYAREQIDAENAAAALLIAEQPRDLQATEHFLPGGEQLDAATFAAAAAERSANGSLQVLAEGCRGWLAQAFRDERAYLSPDAAILRARIAHHLQKARVAPLSLSTSVHFLLTLRAQVVDLRRVIWMVATAAPGRELSSALVAVL